MFARTLLCVALLGAPKLAMAQLAASDVNEEADYASGARMSGFIPKAMCAGSACRILATIASKAVISSVRSLRRAALRSENGERFAVE
jgi:hypothetical protein